MGVANERSIAWGIAKACHDQGAEVAFTFQGEALEKRVRPLAGSIGAKIIEPCDVTNPASIDAVFAKLEKEWGKLDFVVHAIAFSNKDELRGRYLDTTSDNFNLTMNVSVYSFTAVSQRAVPLMKEGGSLLTLTYYGAERVIPHYNVMGVAKAALEASVRYLAADLGEQKIRVNAISAGPIKTLAARRHRRFPLHPEVERAEFAAEAAMSPSEECRRGRPLSAVRSRCRRHRRRSMHVDSGYHVPSACSTVDRLREAGRRIARQLRRRARAEPKAMSRRTASVRCSAFTTWGESHGLCDRLRRRWRAPRRASRSSTRPASSTGWTSRRPGQSRFTTQRQRARPGPKILSGDLRGR